VSRAGVDAADAVLFDLDGCLVDSRVPFVRSLNHALAAHGLPERHPDELVGYLGPPIHGTLHELVGDDEELVAALLITYRARYREHGLAETPVFDGIPELLAGLRDAGLPLVVCTTKAQLLADPLLEAVDLRGFFTAVVGTPSDIAEEPKTVTLARALTLLPDGIAHPVMVGDRRFDIEAAHANGLPGIGVRWGIGDDAELTAAGADALVSTPPELLALLTAATA
jgi:phosphoglycolate phosphatase